MSQSKGVAHFRRPSAAAGRCTIPSPFTYLMVINNGRAAAQTLSIPMAARCYPLSASPLQSTRVQSNATELKLGPRDELPDLAGGPVAAGDVTLAPATITFQTLPSADNRASE